MLRTKDITSFTEHRAHLKDHLRQVNATGRPMFITNNGATEAVVLSPAAYDKLADDAEMARSLMMLDQSMEDIKAGRTQPAKQAVDEIAAEFGLTLERNRARI
jgi:prevent-host-death family protein